MQIQEQHGHGLQLAFVEYRQEIRTAQEHQGSDLAYRIQEHNGNEDQTQDHHQRSMRLVHCAE